MKTKYRSIFISDVHLGTKNCKAAELSEFLKESSCDKLYLVGDMIDGWKIKQNRWYWDKHHTNVMRRILNHAKKGAEVIYVIGNHDEFLRPMLSYRLSFGKIKIVNQVVHVGIDNRRYLVVHGDLFDGISRVAPWVSFLGDRSYDFVLSLNSRLNWLRRKLGFGYWSLSAYLKHRVKKAVDFMFQFEKNMTQYCAKRGFDGVICGHIHHAEIKEVNGVLYLNDGDWVESMTALVEHHDSRWEILYWDDM